MKNLSENSTDELLGIIAKVSATMLRHLNLPEEEVTEFTEQVKERKMAELFENFDNDIDMSSLSKIAKERSRMKAIREGEEIGKEIGRKEGETIGMELGMKKGKELGLKEGETRFAELTRMLLEDGRLDALSRAVSDAEYREKLYLEYGLRSGS